MEYRVIDDELIVHLECSLYTEAVLFKCFYWYGGNYSVCINQGLKERFIVCLTPLRDFDSFPGFDVLIEQIKKDLIDFKLRDIVANQTKTIRELIVAKAFAYYELEEDPLTEVSDPVGFEPKLVC